MTDNLYICFYYTKQLSDLIPASIHLQPMPEMSLTKLADGDEVPLNTIALCYFQGNHETSTTKLSKPMRRTF
jgi:hypothetical protein